MQFKNILHRSIDPLAARLLLWIAAAHTPLIQSARLAAQNAAPQPPAGNEQVRKIMETYAGRGTLADSTPPTNALDAVSQFELRDGLAVDLLASEPDVEQPLYMSWDSRGRLWVIEYRQYQFPAGLQVVSYDSHLRAQFDKKPLPPPHGDKGADRVTVFEDTDGDGFFERHTHVIEGLNIASAAISGANAIWVLNPPYLLKYADTDSDGKPDGDPEVALSGFGIEDTHSVASSLQWGVDGWLYGANGNTSTGNVSSASTKNVKWEGQCIWRFHPVSQRFEIYAEGGGNTFSLEIDSKGRVFSGTNGGGTRGMHYEQGSYGVKTWGKHGPLTNPHAYGFFEHMKHEGDARRFPQAFIVYEGGLLGTLFDGRIVAPNSLANLVYVSERTADGSTFRTRDEAPLMSTKDRWFRPVDAKVGPDGAVYLADWYDTRLSHVRPVDDWHKTSGRIYRVRPAGAAPAVAPFDLHKAPAAELLGLLSHGNRWFRKQAALEIGWRNLSELAPQLAAKCKANNDAHALDALFALDMLGGVDGKLVSDLLAHADPYMRRWAVKIIGEKGAAWTECADALAALASAEEHPEVRAQLLASAKRLPARTALPMLQTVARPMPAGETHLPLLAWWALEAKCTQERDETLAYLAKDTPLIQCGVFESTLASRIGQRFAAGGDPRGLEACERLFASWKNSAALKSFAEGIWAGFEAGETPALSQSLAAALKAHGGERGSVAITAALRSGEKSAIDSALKQLANTKTSTTERMDIAKALADAGRPEAVSSFVALISGGSTPPVLKRAVLQSAAKYSDAAIPTAILGGYEAKIAGDLQVRETALRALCGRLEWALKLVDALDQWQVPAKHITPEMIGVLRQHADPKINAALESRWKGVLTSASMEEKAVESKRIRGALRGGAGDASKGQAIFQARCAACHKLFGEGNVVGPELTGYERGNPDFWLDNLLYPSLEIREGFGNYTARLKNGQILTGMLESQGASGIVLRDLAGQKTRVAQAELQTLEASPISIMPEGLLGGLSDAELRDLMSHLMRPEQAQSR